MGTTLPKTRMTKQQKIGRRLVQPTIKIEKQFREHIEHHEFPCVGAKSALVRDGLTIKVYHSIERTTNDLDLHRDLIAFFDELDLNSPVVKSFIAIFPDHPVMSEAQFETALWDRLQSLHNLDVSSGAEWAENVSTDPQSSHFSMSVAGRPFFVIGLHPRASRPGRQFAYPTLVFNSHDQFERLRDDGRFDKLKVVIRKRDEALAGNINPMLADHGFGSAAAQYSGRVVGNHWSCPLEHKETE